MGYCPMLASSTVPSLPMLVAWTYSGYCNFYVSGMDSGAVGTVLPVPVHAPFTAVSMSMIQTFTVLSLLMPFTAPAIVVSMLVTPIVHMLVTVLSL